MPPTARRRASPKVLLAAAALLVLVGAGVGIAVALSGGSSSAKNTLNRGSLANALPNAAEVQRLLRGIPQHGNVLGKPSAPVSVIEYIDLQCPYCQQFETRALPTLLTRDIRPGKAKLEARILAFIGPDSGRGREAAIAAGQQNKLFNFAELLYFNQGTENTGWLSDTMVNQAAASIPGLDLNRFTAAKGSSAVKNEAATFDSQGRQDGVNQTPTILAGKSGAAPQPVTLASPTDVASVTAAIARALR
jgi:protein-disulfide isomerase